MLENYIRDGVMYVVGLIFWRICRYIIFTAL